MSLLAQDQALTRRVGAITLALLASLVVFLVFILDRIEWGSPMRIRVTFAQTGSLAVGAPLVSAGREIGTIETIALAKVDGNEGIVVTVKLDPDVASTTPKGGDIFVTSRGMLSVRYIELGPPPEGTPVAYLQDGDEFRGNDPPSLDRVLGRTWTNLGIARQFAEEVRPEARALRAEIDALQATMLSLAPEILLRDEFEQLFDEARRTYAAIGGDPGVARVEAIVDETRSTIGQARTSIAKLRASADMLDASLDVLRSRLGGKGSDAIARIEIAIARIRGAIAKVDPLLATVDAIQTRIERGEGSLLKLARDPEFPEDAKELGKILKRQPWKLLDRPEK